jgi:hypothetical protein
MPKTEQALHPCNKNVSGIFFIQNPEYFLAVLGKGTKTPPLEKRGSCHPYNCHL